MFVIAGYEFISFFKRFKPIFLIVLFFLLIVAMNKVNILILGLYKNESNYAAPITALSYFSTIFVFSLSLGTICKEVESGTMRLIVSRTSRTKIIIGKYIGIAFHWFICITIGFGVTSFLANRLVIYNYIPILFFILFNIALCVFLSVIISDVSHLAFISIVIGIGLPLLGMLSVISTDSPMSYIKYLLPQYYLLNNQSLMFIPLLGAIALILISVKIFSRRDL